MKNPLFFFIVFIALLGLCYHNTIQWMINRYLSPDSYYAHGFLIPFISLFFIWQKRNDLLNTVHQISLLGFSLVLLAGLVHLFGTVVYIFSISGMSLWLLIFGTVFYLYGWRTIKVLQFPLFFLLFMFPLPLAIIEKISLPLKIFITEISVFLITAMGIPIFREGFELTLPAGTLLVGNPCSGLRSLITFMVLSSIIAYYQSKFSLKKKWLLFFLSIPIAGFTNLLRVLFLILWSHKFGLEAAAPETFTHTFTGLMLFVIGFLILLFFSRLLGGQHANQ